MVEGVQAAVDGLSFFDWVFARHQNILSWYVRPLFVLPLAYCSWRRSRAGIALTLIALATSMFWFPVPDRVDPRVADFLALEKQWLTGEWTAGKVAVALAAPLSLAAFCLAFWRRSLLWGVAVGNAMALLKVAWSVASGDSGWAVVAPAVTGLVVFDLVAVVASRIVRRDRGLPSARFRPRRL